MTRSNISLLACLVSIFSLYARCTTAEAEPFPIGAFLSLTGDCSDVGDLSKKGIELALEEINAKGGILGRPARLILEDSRESSPMQAVTAYKQLLLTRNLHYFIGPSCSSAGLAVAPLIRRNDQAVTISPTIGLREFNESGANIFKMWPYDEDGPKLLARYAHAQGWKKGAIFSSQQAWEEKNASSLVAMK